MNNRPARRPASLCPALALLAACFALMQIRSVPPPPKSIGAPADQFSAARARGVLEKLVGDGVPHPIGSEANARVRDRVVEQLTALGYQPEVQDAFTCGTNAVCATVHNVVARLDGRERHKAVLLATHFDSVWASPGASDAGVSVGAVIEIARALKRDVPHRNPIILLIDDGEEAGLLGASAFAAQHPAAKETGAVVNLEARGTSGQSVMFETSGDNAWLVSLLAKALSRPAASSLFYPIYERLPNDTDLTVFRRFDMPGVNFAFIGDVAKYHTPLDNLENASPRSLQHQGENALAIVRALAEADLETPPKGNAVFFDLLGFFLVRWGVRWTSVFALAALVLIVASVAMRRERPLRPSRVMAGLSFWALAPVVSGGAAYGFAQLLSRLGAFQGDAIAWPAVAVLTFWLLAFTVVTGMAALVMPWIGRTGAWAGGWLGWSTLGLVAAFYAREASYMAIVPALVAGVTGIFGAGFRRDDAGWLTSALPMATAALVWMPPAWFLFDALGVPIFPVISAAVALMLTPLVPFFSDVAGRWRWGVPGAALVGTCACAAVTWFAPSFSADRPERMNLAFYQETGGLGTRWIASPQSGRLPAAMREAAPFGADLTRAYPWSTAATAFTANATAVEIPAPDLQILERGVRDGHRVVRARLISARGAGVSVLLLPADRVASVTMGGHQIPRRTREEDQRVTLARGPAPRLRSYACVTLPAGGLDVELAIAGDEPVEGYVFDQTPGLPPGGEVLQRARPREATVIGSGDTTVVARRIAI